MRIGLSVRRKGQFYLISSLAIVMILLPIIINTYAITYTRVAETPQKIRTNIKDILESLHIYSVISKPSIPIGNRDILLAIDTSGSMEGQKLEDAKNASKTLLECADETDRLSLMEFSCRGWFGCWWCIGINQLTPYLLLDEENKSTIRQAIDTLTAEGATPLEKTLRKAGNIIEQQADPNRNRMMILMSDGEDTCWGDPCGAMDEGVIPEGVPVYTVGFQVSAEGESQLQCIAEKSGGTYFYAATGEELRDVFCQIVKGGEEQVEDFMSYIRDAIAERLIDIEFNTQYTLGLSNEIINQTTDVKVSYVIENFYRSLDNITHHYSIYANDSLIAEGTEYEIYLDEGEKHTKDVFVPIYNDTNYTSISYVENYLGSELIRNELTLPYGTERLKFIVRNILVSYNVSVEGAFVSDSVIVPTYVLEE